MESLRESEFVASDGRRIPLRPGWFEQKRDWPHSDSFESYVRTRGTRDAYPATETFFLGRLMTANAIYGLLRQHGFNSVNGPMLDICTGTAVMPRAFKALGICTEAHGIDVLDRQTDYPDDLMTRIWEGIPGLVQRRRGGEVFKLLSAMTDIQTGFNNVFTFQDMDFDRRRLAMDGYVVGDFLDYSPSIRFPLVTLAAGLENFPSRRFFAKLADVMTPGGVFVSFSDYFYDVWGASMHIPMDAPWLHARLSTDDFIRYYETLRPELAETAKKAMYFPSTHKTVANYREDARAHGLEMTSYRRAMNQPTIKEMLFTDPDTVRDFHDIILKDCIEINPTVVAEDLFTGILTMVFRKVG